MKTLKTPQIITVILFVLFLLIIVFNRLSSEDKTLRKSSEIDLYVEKIKNNRGFLSFNDSIVISMNTRSINNPDFTMGLLVKPFRIVKKANNDTICIIQYSDTLRFKIIDKNAYNPNNPTIKGFLCDLFSNKDGKE